MAPFIAMSFLLGGIDFVTILISLLVAVPVVDVGRARRCLFLSTLLKSRAMSGLVFGAVGVVAVRRASASAGSLFLAREPRRSVVGGVSVASAGATAVVDAGDRGDVLPGDDGEPGAARREPAVAADRGPA